MRKVRLARQGSGDVTGSSSPTYLQATVKSSHDTNVIVAGDKGTKLQQLMDVMDIVRKDGITDIGIATKNQ